MAWDSLTTTGTPESARDRSTNFPNPIDDGIQSDTCGGFDPEPGSSLDPEVEVVAGVAADPVLSFELLQDAANRAVIVKMTAVRLT